jgi:hypothetical protein
VARIAPVGRLARHESESPTRQDGHTVTQRSRINEGPLVMELRHRLSIVALASLTFVWTDAPSAEPVVVRHVEGLVHGFLSLRSPDGKVIANGDLIQNARGDRVTSRLVFHFKDGSLSDETAVFSQRGHFSLVSDHVVQKGPAFEYPLDMRIDRTAGRVIGLEAEDDDRGLRPPGSSAL